MTLLTQDDKKLLKQFKSIFAHRINSVSINQKSINASTKTIFRLLNWSKGVSIILVSSFENIADWRIAHAGYYFPEVEIKDYNIKIDGKKLVTNKLKSWQKNTQWLSVNTNILL